MQSLPSFALTTAQKLAMLVTMQNFWEISDWESDDKHLNILKLMPFKRIFPFIPEKAGFYVIRGPRQVGKSSWLKTILSYYTKKYSPADCFYLSCENIKDFRELAEILKAQEKTKIILLDEVTFVEDWDRAIKHAIDSGQTHILVITGSNANDLRKGADRMPGRHGHGGEFELLPMTFDEFNDMRAQAGWKNKDRVQELESYFRIGGFPGAIAEAGAKSALPRKTMISYGKWLVGDFLKLGKQEIYLQEMVGQIGKTMCSSISLQKLAQRTQMGSHHTAQEYISVLEDCFALQTIYAIDPDTGGYRFRKEKKFYFRDPIVYWLAHEWLGLKAPTNALESIAEMVAAEHLRRKYSRFGYFHSPKGEIDFFKKDDFAIEVKWSPQISNLSKSYLGMVVPDKKVWFQKNFLE